MTVSIPSSLTLVVKFWIFIKKYIVETQKEARADVVLRWRRAALWVFFVIWLFGLVVLQVICSIQARQSSKSACRPDGSFSPYDNYNPWASSGFFQINLAFGDLTYAEAKAIDTLWDIVSKTFDGRTVYRQLRL
jgi:hypothetical protein